MRSVAIAMLCVSAVLLAARRCSGGAQQRPRRLDNDPRVGLKPGLHDAGEAARNMELVASLPKPEASSIRRRRRAMPTPPETPSRTRRTTPPTPTAEQAAGAAADHGVATG